MNRLELARDSHERFSADASLVARSGGSCRTRLDSQGELNALQTAHRIDPAYGPVTRALSEVHSRRGETSEARAVLKQAATHDLYGIEYPPFLI